MMQLLPGFRDFLPEDCAVRNYIFARWREISRRYGFVEWDGPVLEPTDLYRKKSGAEIVDQLFNFTDKGEREVSMRPELTPTLARVMAAHERAFKKPLKWFSIGQFFRYEKQQRGRLREHYQLNCDIIGVSEFAADIELIALCIVILRGFGLTEKDFVVRVSDRQTWLRFLRAYELSDDRISEFLSIIDKLERVGVDETKRRVAAFGVDWYPVSVVLDNSYPQDFSENLNSVIDGLGARGLSAYIERDCGLVRGLAYYTGTVFEVFDRSGKLRAIAGGGRYDNLIGQLSDGAVSMPALGFAIGDVVLGELLREIPAARLQMHNESQWDLWIDVYIVIAKEERRGDALEYVQQFRDLGYRVDYPLIPTKVPKQFQAAEAAGARIAVLFGDEWPQLAMKNLATGEQTLVAKDRLFSDPLVLKAKQKL